MPTRPRPSSSSATSSAASAAGRCSGSSPALRERHAPTFVVVNGENVAGGLGITPKIADELLAAGVDVITLGNHAYHRKEIYPYLDDEERILRPANYLARSRATASRVVERDGVRLGVVNLSGNLYLRAGRPAFVEIDSVLGPSRQGRPRPRRHARRGDSAMNTTVTVGGANLIPQTNWTLKYADSDELFNEALKAFDGSNSTLWHTKWSPVAPMPHEIQIDLGASYTLSKFSYLPRQDGQVNGTIKDYEFYVSTDGVNWGTSVASGAFTNDTTLKEVSFAAKTGRYIRLRALSEVNNNPWTSVAELNVFGVTQ